MCVVFFHVFRFMNWPYCSLLWVIVIMIYEITFVVVSKKNKLQHPEWKLKIIMLTSASEPCDF